MRLKIKEYYKAERWSYTSLGKALGVTKQTILNWNKGTHMPGIIMIKALAELLKVDVEDLISELVECSCGEMVEQKDMTDTEGMINGGVGSVCPDCLRDMEG